MVKSNKGITLLSLIIYIILLTLVLAMLGIISDVFYSNTKYVVNSGKNIYEFNKFNMYFIEDVKNNKETYEVTPTQIVFEDGTVYTYSDKSIYRNKVEICKNVELCNFSKTEQKVENTTKKIINVQITIKGSQLFTTQNEYVLKYW